MHAYLKNFKNYPSELNCEKTLIRDGPIEKFVHQFTGLQNGNKRDK